MSALVFVLALALAFANGANDNAKGVATLVGFGAASPRAALGWAALSTALGAAVAAGLGSGLLRIFRASFVAGGEALEAAYFAAALAGAVAWVLFATRTGRPVSTTHAILGGLVGAGVAAAGAGHVAWSLLARSFALPLLVGPLVALALVYAAGRPLAAALARRQPRCLCAVPVADNPAPGVASARLVFVADEEPICAAHGATTVVSESRVLGVAHWTTCGLTGFARGWNDAPKIAALALVALPAGESALAFAGVTVAMATGGLLAGGRVLATLAHRITVLPLGESLAASAGSSLLVGLASWQGLPLSTTHVTTGGLLGAGLARDARQIRWATVRAIALAWLVTLPAAAVAAALGYLLLR